MNDSTREKTPSFCRYYQATVMRETCWFVVAILKSFDHVSLDRTVDVRNSVFEFFVPEGMNRHFLDIMDTLIHQGYASNLHEMPNRLCDASEQV